MRQQVKILSIALFLSCGTIGLFAQHDHEFSLYGGGGSSTLNYKTPIGVQKNGLGGHFGLGYHLFFSQKWGIGTGAELAFYNSWFKMTDLDIRYNTFDRNGDPFEFRSMINGYIENRQRVMALQIPLMLQFQTNKADSKSQFFMAVGGKAGIPMREKYRATADLSNAGYYANEDALYDTQEFMGFGNFSNRKDKGNLNFKTIFLASAEAGVKWNLNEKRSLYAGAYMDYGLNNIKKKQDISSLPSIVEYNRANPTEFAVNSIFQSQYTQSGTLPHAFTEKIIPIAVGIKLRLAFGKDNKRPAAQTQSVSQVTPPIINNLVDEAKRAAEEAARKAEADRLAKEREAQRAAEEKVRQEESARRQAEETALNAAKKQIEQPVDDFTLSQTELAAYQRQGIDEKISLLQRYPNLRFSIYGHTCETGSKDVNERVGLGRAAAVKAYMISKGIAENRILNIASKRDTEPVTPNTNEENRKKNRRVQLVIQ